jgi:molybdenum cofactor guanylyltransferase
MVLGSTGRNSGKTEFACAVIRTFRRAYPIVGVKITTVKDDEGACPRGGVGCGACVGLAGDFEIAEERGAHPGKDTARMLESGARRVFWVKCRTGGMGAALEAVGRLLDHDDCVVVESNSVAEAIEPDLFFMLKHEGSPSIKPSAAAVMPLAHRVILSSGHGFDLRLQHLAITGGEWRLAEASAAILAGGKSSRMGQDKSLLPVEGKPLIRHIFEQLQGQFDDILVSTNDPTKYAFLGARSAPDREPGQGPLAGIASAVEAARHERVFVIACDIPVIDLDTAKRMVIRAESFDCVIAKSSVGHEPLFAVYRRNALPAIRAVLEAGERRISAIFPRVRTHFYDLGSAPWYRNLNTREDLVAYLGHSPSPP